MLKRRRPTNWQIDFERKTTHAVKRFPVEYFMSLRRCRINLKPIKVVNTRQNYIETWTRHDVKLEPIFRASSCSPERFWVCFDFRLTKNAQRFITPLCCDQWIKQWSSTISLGGWDTIKQIKIKLLNVLWMDTTLLGVFFSGLLSRLYFGVTFLRFITIAIYWEKKHT